MIGAIILVGVIAFGVIQITRGGSDSTAAPSGQAKKGPCPPGQTKVAVLNGTATPGLAASSAGQLKQAQYKVGPVLGDDKAGASSGTGASGTTGSGI